MEFSKIQREIFNPIKENLQRLAEIFPAAVKDGQVDFAVLKAELGQFEAASEKLSERYELGWAGKEEAKRLANTDIVGRTLKYVPEDSKNPETTENLYIEGDNLEVLKLLRNSYYNKIKMIYIDPPYNTGNDFIYKDDYAISNKESEIAEGQRDEEGNRLIRNQKSSARFHSAWLSMMYPRIKVARDLLTEDGVMFISINDNELQNLISICNEIFNDTFIACIPWKGKGGGADNEYLMVAHEYILCYAKNRDSYIVGEMVKEDVYPKYDPVLKRRYKTQLARKWGSNSRRQDRPNLFYPVIAPDGTEVYPKLPDGSDGCWRWSKAKMEQAIEAGLVEFVKKDDEWIVYEKIYEPLEGEKTTRKFSTWFDDVGNTASGSKTLQDLFGLKVFNYPKPVELIERLIEIANCEDGDYVLDFFSGSATTAHAVMKINAYHNRRLRYILVQLPEKLDDMLEHADTSAKAAIENAIQLLDTMKKPRLLTEIAKERIRRAGERLKEECKDRAGIEELDTGFKVFKVAATNIRWFSEAIKSDLFAYEQTMSDKDQLDFNPGFTDLDVVYEILLRHRAIPLTAKVEKLSHIGDRTYIFAETVVVCLEEQVTESIIDKIAALEPRPRKIIFRDSAFDDDITLKTNTMLRLEAQMRKHSGAQKKAYRVEFI